MIFAVFDTETTGLPFHMDAPLNIQPRIIEFAGIITDGQEILHTCEFVVNPGIAIEAIITQITGFTNDDLKDKPDLSAHVVDLCNFFGWSALNQPNGERGIIAHNLSFDRKMLQFDLARRDMTLDDIAYRGVQICTVEQTTPFYGRNMKLQELYNMHCGEYVQKHRALDDVMLLHEVCQKFGIYSAFTNKEHTQ